MPRSCQECVGKSLESCWKVLRLNLVEVASIDFGVVSCWQVVGKSLASCWQVIGNFEPTPRTLWQKSGENSQFTNNLPTPQKCPRCRQVATKLTRSIQEVANLLTKMGLLGVRLCLHMKSIQQTCHLARPVHSLCWQTASSVITQRRRCRGWWLPCPLPLPRRSFDPLHTPHAQTVCVRSQLWLRSVCGLSFYAR